MELVPHFFEGCKNGIETEINSEVDVIGKLCHPPPLQILAVHYYFTFLFIHLNNKDYNAYCYFTAVLYIC